MNHMLTKHSRGGQEHTRSSFRWVDFEFPHLTEEHVWRDRSVEHNDTATQCRYSPSFVRGWHIGMHGNPRAGKDRRYNSSKVCPMSTEYLGNRTLDLQRFVEVREVAGLWKETSRTHQINES